mgnify:CR=1 FL=1
MNDENYNDTDWGSPCGSGGCGEPDDVLSCIPMPCGCCRVLRKLRAPAVRLKWRIDKQAIPDLDREKAAGKGTDDPSDADTSADGQSGTDPADGGQTCTCGDDCTGGEDCACGASDGTSTMRGSMTVRLFDLCLVGGTMLLLCGMTSCCRKLCRKKK